MRRLALVRARQLDALDRLPKVSLPSLLVSYRPLARYTIILLNERETVSAIAGLSVSLCV